MNNIKDFDQYLKEKYFKLSKKDKEYLLDNEKEIIKIIGDYIIKKLEY